MYDRSLFLKLNNYGYSDESIIEVKDYLMNLRLPEKVDTNAKGRRIFVQIIRRVNVQENNESNRKKTTSFCI